MTKQQRVMKWHRYLFGKIRIVRIKSLPWSRPRITRYWSGRIILFSVGKMAIELDCRKDFIRDMARGQTE